MLRRVGLIGDIHCAHTALRIVLAHLRDEGVDRILAVGDVVDGRGDVSACLKLLSAPDVDVVRGNHERWLLAGTMRDLPDATASTALSATERDQISAWPPTRRFATPLGGALLCHGLGSNDMARLMAHDEGYALSSNDALQQLLADKALIAVMSGHSHVRGVRTLGNVAFINAGTLIAEPGFAIVDFTQGEVTTHALLVDGNVVLESAMELRR